MVLQKQFLDYLAPNGNIEDPLSVLAEQNQLAFYEHRGNHYSADTLREIEELNQIWKKDINSWKIWKK